jgi:hypothetical protein
MRIMTSRATATAAAALIALTTMSLQPAAAGWRHGDEAAALAVFGVVLGTIAAIVAAEHDHAQPAYAPAYPYDSYRDAYARDWHHRGPIHGRHEHWRRHDER